MAHHQRNLFYLLILYSMAKYVQTTGVSKPNPIGAAPLSSASSVHHSEFRDVDNSHSIPVTVTTSTQTSTPTPAYTILYDSFKHDDCRIMAMNYSYENDICHAPNPESYMTSQKALYSCENRCGQTPAYNDGGTLECSCDSKCIFYDDCCQNMQTVCKEVYETGTSSYGKMTKYCSICHSMHNQLYICAGKTLPFDIYSDKNLKHYRYFISKPLPLPARRLTEWSNSLKSYSVVRVSEGLVYRNSYMFYLNNGESRPFFVPQIAIIKCSRAIVESASLNESLQWCATHYLQDAKTSVHRSCNFIRTINCRCSNGEIYVDHVHNICSGVNGSTPKLNRHKLWSNQLENGILPIPDGVACALHKEWAGTVNSGLESTGSNRVLKISISPIPRNRANFPNEGTSVMTSTSGNIRSDDKGDGFSKNLSRKNSKITQILPTFSDLAKDKTKTEELNFVVELSKTRERRLLCTSLASYMTECQLLDCAHGYFMSKNFEVHKTFGGSKCLLPLYITVGGNTHNFLGNLPLCWCVKIVGFLNKIGMWTASIKSAGTTCVIELERIVKDDPPLEVYENALRIKWPEPRTKWTPTLESFFKKARLQSKSSNFSDHYCYDLKIISSFCVTFEGGTRLDGFGKPCNEVLDLTYNKGHTLSFVAGFSYILMLNGIFKLFSDI